MRNWFKHGFTLTEIMMAVILMAFSFLPIIGVMSSSMKATEKDENTQRAVSLCQEKMNIALQMPFDAISVGPHTTDIVTSGLTIELGDKTKEGVLYQSSLNCDYYTVEYNVPECNFVEKGKYPNAPSKWFTNGTSKHEIEKMVKRYTVTVTWRDIGSKEDQKKSYVLSSLKANLKEVKESK